MYIEIVTHLIVVPFLFLTRFKRVKKGKYIDSSHWTKFHLKTLGKRVWRIDIIFRIGDIFVHNLSSKSIKIIKFFLVEFLRNKSFSNTVTSYHWSRTRFFANGNINRAKKYLQNFSKNTISMIIDEKAQRICPSREISPRKSAAWNSFIAAALFIRRMW